MNSLFDTIFLLIPGFTTLFWIEAWTTKASTNPSELERTLKGLMFSIPVFAINWFCFILAHLIWPRNVPQLLTFNEMKAAFSNLVVVAIYISLSFVVAYLVALAWVKVCRPQILRLVNGPRLKDGLSTVGKFEQVWDQVFGIADNQVVRIRSINGPSTELCGIINRTSNPTNGEHVFELVATKHVELRKERLKEPLSTFVDFDRNIVIDVYDPESLFTGADG